MYDFIDCCCVLLGFNVLIFYEELVYIVCGEGVWMWDVVGNKYFDCYNNVFYVGYCNLCVVDVICD